jgi:hypothetical protein
MLGRNPEDEREDNEGDGPLFLAGEDKQTKPLAQIHGA